MTDAELIAGAPEYRSGVQAEIVLLTRLQVLSLREREITDAGELDPLGAITDQRERVMAQLVVIEHEIKPFRQRLLARREALAAHPIMQEVLVQHQEAAALVFAIVTQDRQSLESLKAAEHARKDSARALEQGETTLAAYRRVVAPYLAGATLVNRKG